MRIEKQRELSRLNKEIKQEQAKLVEAFTALHQLHHERGALLFGDEALAAAQRVREGV